MLISWYAISIHKILNTVSSGSEISQTGEAKGELTDYFGNSPPTKKLHEIEKY